MHLLEADARDMRNGSQRSDPSPYKPVMTCLLTGRLRTSKQKWLGRKLTRSGPVSCFQRT